MILEKNPGIKHYRDVQEGQLIRVPIAYAQKMTLDIDPLTYLPVIIEIFDEQGLYERYEYRDIRVNPAFGSNTFREDNPQYSFR